MLQADFADKQHIAWLEGFLRRVETANSQAARFNATRCGQSLMTARPILAESQSRFDPMSEIEEMRKIEARTGEANNDAKALYLSPAEARRRTFAILQRHMAVMAEPGTAQCETLMMRLADAYARPAHARSNVRPVTAGLEDEAMAMLRARCAICPERCARPVE